ncbi:TetR/AcrR family transcriptional regulator [Mycolicibacterium sp. 018/SC-01/001]|uniref:TetR/AcrR family transcriptional regulator n=1 Tax=Mycolicibacterium sp. 018/SC-01/001 TaxID=2592069 RepID=UPI00117CC7B1|nr:TetR/AcrR family transcriptional regulator [Mycolicibacterium sp. 018/SC-01/001]TRW78705.1 TetR/AcrR family transcriptional regulator [Mycolicibacterium sp. 018/SC-01/001]
MTAMPEAVIAAGVRLLERDGVAALRARTVAAEAGTSTMAVYTHFGGMTGLLDAIAREVFDRFAAVLTEVPQTDDPVADFFAMGRAYHRFALENPQRYQLMFGTSTPSSIARHRVDLTSTDTPSDRADWAASFDALREAVRRMMAAGRIRPDDEAVVAGRMWSVNHGAVMLETAGFFGREGHGLSQILGPLVVDALVGMGDDRDAVMRSLRAALASEAADQPSAASSRST